METDFLKQYLDQVIIRMDFLQPEDFVSDNIPPDLHSTIMKSFPIAEPREFLAQELQISGNQEQQKFEQKSLKIKEWNYYGREREKQFSITKECFFISYKKYESFNMLKEDFSKISKILFSLNPDIQFKRIGLRYVNTLKDGKKGDVFNWKKFKLNKNLLSIFNITSKEDKQKISRAFQVLEINYDEFNLRFQYGMHNPDYPAAIRQKLFTLDFDASYQGLLSKESDLDTKITKFHDAIKNLIGNC